MVHHSAPTSWPWAIDTYEANELVEPGRSADVGLTRQNYAMPECVICAPL